MSVCVCGCVALTDAWKGGRGAGRFQFLGGGVACFLSSSGDILDLFSGVVLWCSCPSRSNCVYVGRGAQKFGFTCSLSKKAFLFRDTNLFLIIFVLLWFF